jgi:hypothetical protein
MEKNINIGGYYYSVVFPDECPICHHHGETSVIRTYEMPDKTEVQIVFQCAYSGCKCFFIGYYGPKPDKNLKILKPQKPKVSDFPEIVRELSSDFFEIFKEAEEAYQLGMKQIAGPGYRKAFEFLIKDYAKSLKPSDSDNIEKSFSGKVINDYVSDPRIQIVANRALWLGNDESHYLKKWEEQNINDLIILIKLSINWIENERITESYRKKMPE